MKNSNNHVPSGWCVYSKFAYRDVKNPLKLYWGEDCVKKFCEHIEQEACRLYHEFPEKPMNPLTNKQLKEFRRATRCHICYKHFN